jgi:hypothetical protein
MTIPATGTPPLRERALYNIGVKLANGSIFTIAPHSIYVRTEWENFGLISRKALGEADHPTSVSPATRTECHAACSYICPWR